jgi:hypothetical protein
MCFHTILGMKRETVFLDSINKLFFTKSTQHASCEAGSVWVFKNILFRINFAPRLIINSNYAQYALDQLTVMVAKRGSVHNNLKANNTR